MNKEQLHQAYIETTYRVLKSNIFENNIDLSVNELNEKIEIELPQLQSWAFITAFNPLSEVLTDEENQIRNKQLADNFKALNLSFHPAIGISKDKKWSEESFFIENISEQKAFELADKYKQNAYVYSKVKEKAALVYCK